MLVRFPHALSTIFAEVNTAVNITLVQHDWDSSALATEVARILLTERVGVVATPVMYDVLTESLLNQTGIDYGLLSVRRMIADGHATADVENWDDTMQSAPIPGVTEGMLGYLGQAGWFIPTSLANANRELLSYVSYKYSSTARIFDPALNITISQVAGGATTRSSVADYLAAAQNVSACSNSTSSFDASACLQTLLHDVGNENGVFFAASTDVDWFSVDQPIINSLGLKLTVQFVSSPSESGLISSIQDAQRNDRPWIGYMYTPSAVFSNYSGVSLSRVLLPQWMPECDEIYDGSNQTLYPCDYAPGFVKKFVTNKLQAQAPHAYQLITQLTFDDADMSDMLGRRYFSNLSIHDAACNWIKSNPVKVASIVPRWHRTRPTCAAGEEPRYGNQEWVCTACSTDTFNLAANGTCRDCPQGATCPGGATILAGKHYWHWPASDPMNPLFYSCAENKCCVDGACPVDDTCPPDRTGNLCASCRDPNHYLWNGQCADCSTNSTPAAVLLPLAVAFIVMFLFLLLSTKQGESVFISDMILFFQLVTLLVSKVDLANIFILKATTFNLDSIFDGVVPHGLCILPLGNMERTALKAVIPFLFWMILGIYHGIAVAYQSLKTQYPALVAIAARLPVTLRNVHSLTNFFLTRYFLLFTVTYMPIIEGALQLLNCRNLGGQRYLATSPDLLCYQGRHLPVAIYAIFIIVVWVGVLPLGLFVKLRRLMRAGTLGDEAVVERWGVLYVPYRKQFAWYPVLDMVKRALITIASVVIPQSTETEFVINLAVLLIVLWLYNIEHVYSRPLYTKLDNHLRSFSYGSMLMLTATSMIKSPTDVGDYTNTLNNLRLGLLFLFLFLPCLLIPWFVLWNILRFHHKQQRKQHDRGSSNDSSKLSPTTGATSAAGSGLGSLASSALALVPRMVKEHHVTRLHRLYRIFGSERDLETFSEELLAEKQSRAKARKMSVPWANAGGVLRMTLGRMRASSAEPALSDRAAITLAVPPSRGRVGSGASDASAAPLQGGAGSFGVRSNGSDASATAQQASSPTALPVRSVAEPRVGGD
ncbi:hypothetical protein GGF32_003443 [Allomyces javanicus]|nr:hypothetical protein GGF32_003443 [Allomyces javanicus]